MMRAANEEGLLRFTRNDQDLLLKKINEFVESGSYNFKQLISIYYDLTSLNRLNKEIRQHLYDKLCEQIDKNSLRTLAIFNLQILLKAFSQNTDVNVKDIQIYNKVISFI